MIAFVGNLGKVLHGNFSLFVALREVETLCASSATKCKADFLRST